MKNSYRKLLVISTLCLFMQPVVAEQSITAELSEYADTLSISPSYNVTPPQNGSETGLGLRLHFDSSKLKFVGITDLYPASSLGISAVQNDTENTDQDDATDKVIVTSWLDISGQWPSAGKLPLKLYAAKFDKKSDYTGATTLRFSSSSHALGSTFRAEPVTYSEISIPTLSEWMMILMSLGLWGVVILRNYRKGKQ